MRGAFNFDRGIASTRRTSLHRHRDGLGALRGLKLKAGLKGSETLEAAGMAAASHTQPAVSSMVTYRFAESPSQICGPDGDKNSVNMACTVRASFLLCHVMVYTIRKAGSADASV